MTRKAKKNHFYRGFDIVPNTKGKGWEFMYKEVVVPPQLELILGISTQTEEIKIAQAFTVKVAEKMIDYLIDHESIEDTANRIAKSIF